MFIVLFLRPLTINPLPAFPHPSYATSIRSVPRSIVQAPRNATGEPRRHGSADFAAGQGRPRGVLGVRGKSAHGASRVQFDQVPVRATGVVVVLGHTGNIQLKMTNCYPPSAAAAADLTW